MEVSSGSSIPAFRRHVTISKERIKAGFDADIIPTDGETPRTSCQNIWFATQEMNRRPPKYITGVLLSEYLVCDTGDEPEASEIQNRSSAFYRDLQQG
jgi:hypothetical protein